MMENYNRKLLVKRKRNGDVVPIHLTDSYLNTLINKALANLRRERKPAGKKGKKQAEKGIGQQL